MTGAEGHGFAQKALVIVLGLIVSVLLAFFVWLATAVTDVRERVVRIETSLTSLLDTRTVQAEETSNRNARRIEQLEKDTDNGDRRQSREP